ncbi:MAG: pyridoxal-phosphate dependent enzyme [Deltaproteobacteria bacterium]|nr:pyridoxal-phosphate dependent enzyme [Deltaproteobacteria bacterium]
MAERYPELIEALAPIELASLPTPVERMAALGAELTHGGLYVKRDDLSSAVYGGNKVRKLEFLLGEARRQGARTLVTMGGIGSNHLLATALHGRSLGMRTVGVVFPQPLTAEVRRNLDADRAAGVELVHCPHKYLLPAFVSWTLGRLAASERRRPLLIPGGGSSPLGSLGFAAAAFELAAQVRDGALPEPAEIFVPYGTGGTSVGLAVGLALCGLRSRVVAVRVIDRILANRPRMALLARGVARLLGQHGIALPTAPRLEIQPAYFGAGYGHPTPAGRGAQARFLRTEGLALEPTYTAKAAAAFTDRARKTRRPLLFWHTYNSAEMPLEATP